jgi:putative transposase
MKSGSKLPLKAQRRTKSGSKLPHSKDSMTQWPHSPIHKLSESGAYIVTAGTYLKAHHFRKSVLLDFLQSTLFLEAVRFGWRLQAWAIFSNHYHFIALSPIESNSLPELLRRLHSITGREANRVNGSSGQKIWHQYWDTHLTYERSYYARLNYVHQNPCRHKLVSVASSYPWCSAAWFERKASPVFVKTISSFRTDRISIHDDFEVIWQED